MNMQEQFDNTAKVLVTTNFYRSDADGNIKFNDETGARFWTRAYGDGSIGIVVSIDKAQNILKAGRDVTAAIVDNRATVRLSKDDYKLLKEMTKKMPGIGAKFIVELEKEPHISRLDITKSRRGNNGRQTAVTLWGTIVSEPTPATSQLSEVGINTEDPDDYIAALLEGKQQVIQQRDRALATTRAARDSMANTIESRDSAAV